MFINSTDKKFARSCIIPHRVYLKTVQFISAHSSGCSPRNSAYGHKMPPDASRVNFPERQRCTAYAAAHAAEWTRIELTAADPTVRKFPSLFAALLRLATRFVVGSVTERESNYAVQAQVGEIVWNFAENCWWALAMGMRRYPQDTDLNWMGFIPAGGSTGWGILSPSCA